MNTDLSPPWILFSDDARPVAILPAGRPGEVANVSHLTMKQAQRIVMAANRLHRVLEELHMQALWKAIDDITERINKTHIKLDVSGP